MSKPIAHPMFRSITILSLLLILSSSLPAQTWKPDTHLQLFAQGISPKTLSELQALNPATIKGKKAQVHYFFARGFVEDLLGDTAAARQSFLAALRLKKRSPYAWAGLAFLAARAGDRAAFQHAEAKVQKWDKPHKQVGPALMLALGWQVLDTGPDRATAKQRLYQLRQNHPNNPYVLYQLAHYYEPVGVSELAVAAYQQCLDLHPDLVPAWHRLALAMIDLKHFDAAADYANRVVALNPDYVPIFAVTGELWLRAKDFARAGRDFKKYLKLYSDDHRIRQRLGESLFLLGDYAGALAELTQLTAHAPLPNVVVRLLAFSYFETRQYEQATAWLDRYWAQVPDVYRISEDYRYRGMLSYRSGDTAKAQTQFDIARALDLDNPELNRKLAQFFAAEKDYERYAHYVELAIASKTEKDFQDYLELGKAAYFISDFPKALRCFETSMSLAVEAPEPHYWQSETLRKIDPTDSTGQALAAAKRVLDLLEREDLEQLSAQSYRYLLNSLIYVTYTYYAPQPDGSGNCEAARAFALKLIHLEPTHPLGLAVLNQCP